VCAVGGDRVALVARGDTFSFAGGCSAVQSIAVSFAPTSAGSYLSLVSYNEGDTVADSQLRVDNIRLTRSTVDFECQAPGAFPTAGGDCGFVTGTTGSGGSVTASAAPSCGMPTSGTQYARLLAGANIDIPGGGTIARPLAANVSEVRVAIPTGASHVSFDYSFNNAEGTQGTYIDGYDVAVVDSTGALLFQCVKGDASTAPVGCSGPAHFNSGMPAAPAGAYLSLVCFNSLDTSVDSILLVDSICFVGRPRLTFSAPLGAGSLASRIDCANPFDFVLMPVTLAPGAFPFGAFYGVDISLLDLFAQVGGGAPFFTTTDAKGVYEFGPIPGLPSGLTIYATVLDGLTSPNPRVGLPAAFTIP
ncbi:MAG TPA: hypothetical protein VEI02_06030, partial [Planctomycetota bacterium]|nr:hypothetical protein [Planctomycetota bacterium]